MRAGRQTVWRLRVALIDDGYGNQVRDWASSQVQRVPLEHASLQPVQGTEETAGRDTVVTRWRLWCRPTDLVASDRIAYQNAVFRIAGEVEQWGVSEARGHTTALLERCDDAAV